MISGYLVFNTNSLYSVTSQDRRSVHSSFSNDLKQQDIQSSFLEKESFLSSNSTSLAFNQNNNVVSTQSPSKHKEATFPIEVHWMAWLLYWMVESYGTIIVAMLWTLFGSLMDYQSAKSAYPIIVGVAQIGAILGATAATYTTFFGFTTFFIAQAFILSAMMILIRMVLALTPAEKSVSLVKTSTNEDGTASAYGAFDGIRLIVTDSFVRNLAIVATFSEIVGVIVEYQMKVMARYSYTSGTSYAEFMGSFGQATNAVSLIFALTGSRYLLQTMGVRWSLLAFPIVTFVLMIVLYLFPTLYIAFLGMVLMKALSNSLNNPVKELLYVNSSPEVRWKAKSWIDMFGTRAAKATGSFMNSVLVNASKVVSTTTSPTMSASVALVSTVFIVVWIRTSDQIGHQHEAHSNQNLNANLEEVTLEANGERKTMENGHEQSNGFRNEADGSKEIQQQQQQVQKQF